MDLKMLYAYYWQESTAKRAQPEVATPFVLFAITVNDLCFTMYVLMYVLMVNPSTFNQCRYCCITREDSTFNTYSQIPHVINFERISHTGRSNKFKSNVAFIASPNQTASMLMLARDTKNDKMFSFKRENIQLLYIHPFTKTPVSLLNVSYLRCLCCLFLFKFSFLLLLLVLMLLWFL